MSKVTGDLKAKKKKNGESGEMPRKEEERALIRQERLLK